MPRTKTTAQTIKIAKRRSRAVELRTEGQTFEQIATTIAAEFNLPNYSRQRCHEDVTAALAELNESLGMATELLKARDLEILDRLQSALWASAITGEVKSALAVIKIVETRAKFLGTLATVEQRAEAIVHRDLSEVVDQLQSTMSPASYAEMLRCITSLQKNHA